MKKYLIILALFGILTACGEKLPPVPADSNITGIALPVRLGPGLTEIPLSDFFLETGVVENVKIPGLDENAYKYENGSVFVNSIDGMDALLSLDVKANGIIESIPLFRSSKQKIELSYDPKGEAHKSVTVRGEFNGWTAGRPDFQMEDGIWKGTLMLDPGTYQYLIVVDGEEGLDPGNALTIDNNMGGRNSVLAVGLDISKRLPEIFTIEHDGDDIDIEVKGELNGLMAFWQNVRLPQAFIAFEEDGEYEIKIPEEAENLHRSFLRIWAWNEFGISNDLLIPLEYGRVVEDPKLITRHDQHAMILYNAFVDRFNDADSTNNRPLRLPEVLPPADYHGGDIAGVTAKISDGYFKDLGVNTIWISPVVKNPEGAFGYWPNPPSKFSGYHGYWPISFTLIDDRYGTEEDLHALVKTAHENNMNVLLDFVANHVHQEHPVYQAHPEWATELYLPDGSLNTERWDEYRLTTWFDVFLPTLDLAKPEVYEMLSDSAIYWLKKYDLDGFRHDATKHIPEVFWRALTRKVKEQIVSEKGVPVYQIGETYGGPELISSYVGSGMLDAQFDFNVYDDAIAVLTRQEESFARLDASLHESFRYYGSHNLMGYITGNQDRGRFTSYAGGGLFFDEDAKLAGWTRDVFVGNAYGYLLTEMLFAFNMTIPGLPVIYYGDEIGMAGGNDPDSRRMMRFEDLSDNESRVRQTVSQLANLRRHTMALLYGDFTSLLVTDQTYAYCRTYFDEVVIVVMNKGDQAKNLTFDLPERFTDIEAVSLFGTKPGIRQGRMSITLDGRKFDVYSAKN